MTQIFADAGRVFITGCRIELPQEVTKKHKNSSCHLVPFRGQPEHVAASQSICGHLRNLRPLVLDWLTAKNGTYDRPTAAHRLWPS
jgi:hypothetical protein